MKWSHCLIKCFLDFGGLFPAYWKRVQPQIEKKQQKNSLTLNKQSHLFNSPPADWRPAWSKRRRQGGRRVPAWVCVVLTGHLIHHRLWKRQSDTETPAQSNAEGRSGEGGVFFGWGGGGAAAEKSEVVSPFPVTRETNPLSKKNGDQWRTPAIVLRQNSHMTAKTPLLMHGARGEGDKKSKGLGGGER